MRICIDVGIMKLMLRYTHTHTYIYISNSIKGAKYFSYGYEMIRGYTHLIGFYFEFSALNPLKSILLARHTIMKYMSLSVFWSTTQ
jgi:hypothetical protein